MEGIDWLASNGTTHYLELGPDPVLTTMASWCLDGCDDPAALVPTLLKRRSEQETETFLSALAQLWTDGASVDWRPAFAAQLVDLVDPADHAALEVELGGDPQEELAVQRVVMGGRRPPRRARLDRKSPGPADRTLLPERDG